MSEGSETFINDLPRRKRQRIQDVNREGQIPTTASTSEPGRTATRDIKYYTDNADLVIRVEDTLFKVHRFLLSRDSSVFLDMFNLPTPGDPVWQAEGSSDEIPLVLSGDTAENFRALLWVLYALPGELQEYGSLEITKKPTPPLLLSIAEITNKYQFISLEAWALNSIYASEFGAQPPPVLARILKIAINSKHVSLRDAVVSTWSDLILSTNVEITTALTLAEHYSLPKLQGAAYYRQLMEFERSNDPLGKSPIKWECSIASDRERQLRLMCGYWSLTRYWKNLCKNPPTLKHSLGLKCSGRAGSCASTWEDLWYEPGSEGVGLADVFAQLNYLEKKAVNLAPRHCMKVGFLALKEQFKEQLISCFRVEDAHL